MESPFEIEFWKRASCRVMATLSPRIVTDYTRKVSEVPLFLVTVSRLQRPAWFRCKQEPHVVHEIQTNEKIKTADDAGSADHDLKPVPPHLWHFTFLSPCLRRPLPSQFLHLIFRLPAFFAMFSPNPKPMLTPGPARMPPGRYLSRLPRCYGYGSRVVAPVSLRR